MPRARATGCSPRHARGTPWQFLHDYQYRRIDTFLDPTTDPLGAGYNIIQAQIALGSGGW